MALLSNRTSHKCPTGDESVMLLLIHMPLARLFIPDVTVHMHHV